MKNDELMNIESKLQKALTENRFHHTQGVMYTACALAMRYDIDLEKARLAGLLHDCAKCIPNAEKITLCKKYKLNVTKFELEHPVLLHAKLGAYVASHKYHVKDQDILDAITWHTTGKPAMTPLEQIIYIADYIEPNRDKAPNLDKIRGLAFQNLDACMEAILEDTVAYLKKQPKSMDEMTLKAYEYYHQSK